MGSAICLVLAPGGFSASSRVFAYLRLSLSVSPSVSVRVSVCRCPLYLSVFVSLSLFLFLSFSDFLFLCPFWCPSTFASQCPPHRWPSALVFLCPSLPLSPYFCEIVLPTSEPSPAAGLRGLLSLSLYWVFGNYSFSHVLLWKMLISLYLVVALESTALVTSIYR